MNKYYEPAYELSPLFNQAARAEGKVEELEILVEELQATNNLLQDKLLFHNCLLEAGVDNWSGYSEAWQLYNEYINDDEE